MVGMVVTISPSLSLYKMVVFPAASRPTIRIPAKPFCVRGFVVAVHNFELGWRCCDHSRISAFPKSWVKSLEIERPMIEYD